MRILQVIGSLAPRYGGPSTSCPALCRALAERGHDAARGAIASTGSPPGRATGFVPGAPAETPK